MAKFEKEERVAVTFIFDPKNALVELAFRPIPKPTEQKPAEKKDEELIREK